MGRIFVGAAIYSGSFIAARWLLCAVNREICYVNFDLPLWDMALPLLVLGAGLMLIGLCVASVIDVLIHVYPLTRHFNQ